MSCQFIEIALYPRVQNGQSPPLPLVALGQRGWLVRCVTIVTLRPENGGKGSRDLLVLLTHWFLVYLVGHTEPLHLILVQKDYILSSSIASRIGVHTTAGEPSEVSSLL